MSSTGTASICSPKARLEGRVAIVTGGAHGIGEATVRLFSSHGAKVVVADVDEQAGENVCRSLGSNLATFVHCDVSIEEDVSRAVDVALQKYGQLDVMFNNAGIVASPASNILDVDMAEFDRVMSVNCRGTMCGMKHAARAMIPRGKGCIISNASIASVIGGLAPHAYTASKHAIVGLTKNVAAELGKYGIRVNAISPYGILTDMTVEYRRNRRNQSKSSASEGESAEPKSSVPEAANLLGSTITVEDIAKAALYLASDEAKYVSAHNLVVDGGFVNVNHSLGVFR